MGQQGLPELWALVKDGAQLLRRQLQDDLETLGLGALAALDEALPHLGILPHLAGQGAALGGVTGSPPTLAQPREIAQESSGLPHPQPPSGCPPSPDLYFPVQAAGTSGQLAKGLKRQRSPTPPRCHSSACLTPKRPACHPHSGLKRATLFPLEAKVVQGLAQGHRRSQAKLRVELRSALLGLEPLCRGYRAAAAGLRVAPVCHGGPEVVSLNWTIFRLGVSWPGATVLLWGLPPEAHSHPPSLHCGHTALPSRGGSSSGSLPVWPAALCGPGQLPAS